MSKLYFAYGSNLNVEQMAQRCPNAEPLGAAYLPSLRLVFRGFADIEEGEAEDLLPVGIWSITEECEKALDAYEGVSSGHYRKIWSHGMLTYTMNRSGYLPPSPYYFGVIKEGYQDFGLDLNHLEEALGWSYFDQQVRDEV